MSDESITYQEDTENLMYIARQIHLEEFSFSEDRCILIPSDESVRSHTESLDRVGSDVSLVQKFGKETGPNVFKNPAVAAKTKPFTLKWSFGINPNVKFVNLTTEKKNQIFCASSHFPLIYDYCKKEAIHLEGHNSTIKSISTDKTGQWLLSAEADPDGSVIVWEAQSDKIVPVRTLYNLYPNGSIGVVKISYTAQFLLTVGVAGNKERVVQLWFWTLGNDQPDDTLTLPEDCGSPTRVRQYKENQEHIMIVFENKVVFFEIDIVSKKIVDSRIPQIYHKEKLGIFYSGTYVQQCHECFVASTTGCVLIFSNTLYTKEFTEEEISNKKIFRNAVKISPVSIFSITSVDGIIAVGDARGYIMFFDKRFRILFWLKHFNLGPITSIDFNKRSKYKLEDALSYFVPKPRDDRIFSCGFTDLVDELEAIFKKDLPNDASLERAPFFVNDFFVATSNCNVYAIDPMKKKCTSLFYVSEDCISCIETHDERDFIVIGYADGRMMIVDFEKYVVLNTIVLPAQEKGNAITCIKYSKESFYLVCGRKNGQIWILDPILLTPKVKTPFTITEHEVKKIVFSSAPLQFAYYDSFRTVVLFTFTLETNEWVCRGKIRSHYSDITDILFMPTLPLSRLYTISEDRHIVLYNNTKVPKEEFNIHIRERFEQTAIPICFTYLEEHYDDKRCLYFLIADDQHKLKIVYESTRIPKTVLLGPAFGCFKNQQISKMQVIPKSDSRYMIFSTEKYLGIHILPPDGNPFKCVGYLAHPNGLVDFRLSHDGKYIFSFGKEDHCAIKWEIKTRSVELMNLLGGKELEPYYSLLEGGRNGWLFHEIQDLFYYMQILQQENIDLPRRVSDTLSVNDIPDLVRTCGFFPSEFEVENMLIDIRYRQFDETQKINEDISFIDFIKLFCNHKPAYGYNLNEIEEAFKVLQTHSSKPLESGIDRDEFIYMLTTQGEPMLETHAFKCFRTLMRATETQESFDFLPKVITFDIFRDVVLGIDMSREKIQEDENKTEKSGILSDDEDLSLNI